MANVKKTYHLTGEHFYKFFQCPHWIWYDLYEDRQKMGRTPALMEMIRHSGLQHEREIIKSRKFEEIKPELFKDLDEAFLATLELMKKGENIYHGVLMDGHWAGIPDLLEARPLEVGMRSNFGDHYYVVYDIKSGEEIKEEYKFQLAFYSVILERIQKILPREAYVINGSGQEMSFVVDDFLDYFHLTRERIEKILDGEKPVPFLKSTCKTSPWYSLCLEETKGCDDVSLIHRLSQNDQRRLYDLGIHTVSDLASSDLQHLVSNLEDWPFDKILRFHNQAASLVKNEPVILKKNDFPRVSTEVYFDIESDPTEEIDYLLGVLLKKGEKTEYKYFLAADKPDEGRIWREFLDFLDGLPARRSGGEDDFVIYHYANFEQQVFRRLANRYGISRELEEKFKNNSFDLYKIAVESVVLPLYFYSLKDIAKYIGFKWDSEDAGGAESVVWYNDYLKTKDRKILDKILRYNEDDVRATLYVKEWLEKQRPKTSKEKLE